MPARPLLFVLRESPFVTTFSKKFAYPRWALVKPFIQGKKIIDVGLGMGTFAKLMIGDGYQVTGLDVDNTSLYHDVQPLLYDGFNIPFAKNTFDTATIICVLHHCQNQEQMLQEVMRVSRVAIVIEDTFRNPFEHLLVAIRDSVENWEFYPHHYRSYEEWKALCHKNKWRIKHVRSWSSWDFGLLYGRQSCFRIEK